MPNQYKISENKRVDILLGWFFYPYFSQKEMAKRYRLSKKTVKRIIKEAMQIPIKEENPYK